MSDEHKSIALIGDVGAGKDAFILSLLGLKGMKGDNLTISVEATELDESNLPKPPKAYTNGGEWPQPTARIGFSKLTISRTSGMGAFYESTTIVNAPGALLRKKTNSEASLTLDETRSLNDIGQADFLIVMLDIAQFLTKEPRESPEVLRKDRDLAIFIEALFLFLFEGKKSNTPTAFCITKIDGKFIDRSKPELPSDVYDSLERVANIGSGTAVTGEIVRDAIQFVDENWPAELRLDGRHSSEPQNWTREEVNVWYQRRQQQLNSGLVNDKTIFNILKDKTNKELKALIESQMPKVANAINNRYHSTPHEYFAISAAGNKLLPGEGARPINTEKVISYVLHQREEKRQQKRKVWGIIRRYSKYTRHPWLEVMVEPRE